MSVRTHTYICRFVLTRISVRTHTYVGSYSHVCPVALFGLPTPSSFFRSFGQRSKPSPWYLCRMLQTLTSHSRRGHVGIKLTANVPSGTSLNGTLIAKSEDLKKEWSDVLQRAVTALALPPALRSSNHQFALTTFPEGQECSVCSNLLWGLIYQGFECSGCRSKVHHHCLRSITVQYVRQRHN